MNRLSSTIPPVPHPSLRFDPDTLGLTEFPRTFFQEDTVSVARRLLGVWLARQHRRRWYGARIVETEAYLGNRDAAAHSRGGRRTPRVEPMYMDGGHLYVFMVYGMHHCTNVVTRRAGIAEAVLHQGGVPVNRPVAVIAAGVLGIAVERIVQFEIGDQISGALAGE